MITPEMSALEDAVRAEFAAEFADGSISSWGIYNCRRKNNTADGPWSEHAWGNAEDLKISPVGGSAGDKLAAWAESSPLVSETFWKVPLHFDHVHLTANPSRNPDNQQTPPCAEEDDMAALKIEDLQDALREAGYKPGPSDGVYGPKTEKAFVAAMRKARTGRSLAVRLRDLLRSA